MVLKSKKNARVRVAVVDDHEAVRLGFAGICESEALDLVGNAETVRVLLRSMAGTAKSWSWIYR